MNWYTPSPLDSYTLELEELGKTKTKQRKPMKAKQVETWGIWIANGIMLLALLSAHFIKFK